MKTAFTTYWDLALASVDRQLASAASACIDGRLNINKPPVSLVQIRSMLDRVKPIVSSPDAYADPNSGHKIQSSDERFQGTLKWLQKEIRDLLKTLPSDEFKTERKEILHILGLSAEDIAHHFGTLTEGWDRLVSIKHMLLLPNDAVLARSAWLVSLMADFERSLRDAICIPIQCLGRLEPIMQATAATIADRGIELRADAVMCHERTDTAVAQAISESMAVGVAATLEATHIFAKEIGIVNVAGNSFEQGFHVKLESLGLSSEAIILSLVDLRRIALHDTSSVIKRPTTDLHATMKLTPTPLDKWNFTKLQVIAQFLYSYSIQYTLGVMDIVSKAVSNDSRTRELSLVARYKAASELRVGTLVLLKQELWWLAWSLADLVRDYYEDGDGLMLRLNAAFAQSSINMPRDWRRKVVEIEVKGKAPRYHLLKKCILGEWSGISPFIKKAITSGDMTLDELSSWPALARLRDRTEYNKVIQEFGKR
jgi:hypothetical protein